MTWPGSSLTRAQGWIGDSAVYNTVSHDVCGWGQDISTAEEEAAKKKVGGAAAVKQLEKLRKEAAKTSKDAERTAEDLASKKEEHKVSR